MRRDFLWLLAALMLGVFLIVFLRPSKNNTGTDGQGLSTSATTNLTQTTKPQGVTRSESPDLQRPVQSRSSGPNKTGAYRTRAELVAAQDSGDLVWGQIDNLPIVVWMVRDSAIEPFPERTLEALEKVLREASERKHRMAAAALLYRHGRESGRAALLAAVRGAGIDNDTLNAAASLLRNRDEEALPDVLKLVGGNTWSHPALLDELGRWREPRIVHALEEQLRLNPKNYYLALNLVWQGKPSGEVGLADSVQKHGGADLVGIQIQSGLARIGRLSPEQFLSDVDKVFSRSRYVPEIGRALEIAGPGISTPALLRHLEQYIGRHEEWIAGVDRQAEMARNNDPNTYRSYPKNAPTDMMLAAVRILSEWDTKAAIPPLERIIHQVQKRKPDNLNNLQLGLALYKLDPAGWRATLEEAGIQTAMLDRIPEVAKLRPLAPELMPQQKYWLSRPAP